MDFQPNSKTILMLDDILLCCILSYLNTTELLAIERVCWRFRNAAEMLHRTCKVFDFSDFTCGEFFDYSEATKIAQRVGKYVETVKASRQTFPLVKDHSKVLQFICEHFKNLQNIHLDGIFIPHEGITNLSYVFFRNLITNLDEFITMLSYVFRNVRVANLSGCELVDDSLKDLLQLDKIEVLHVTNNPGIKGSFLSKLKKIREINLSFCENLEPHFFIEFCKKSPELSGLNIAQSHCSKIDANCFFAIASRLKMLESLTVSEIMGVIDTAHFILTHLQHLKRLKINYVILYETFNLMDEFLLRISIHNRLEHLDISRAPMSENVTKAISNLKKLKVLKVNNIIEFSDYALAEISCALQELHTSFTFISASGVVGVIQRCPAIKLIDATHCQIFNEQLGKNFISCILRILEERSHVLEILVDDTPQSRKELSSNSPKLKINYVSPIRSCQE